MTMQDLLDAKAKPVGSLGRLEALAVQLATIQDTLAPVVRDPVVLIFAGDHGAAAAVSAFPSAVTGVMVGAYAAGRAAINQLAAVAGARVVVVDSGVAGPAPGALDFKIAPGTADWRTGPAMTMEQVRRALANGAAVVDTFQYCTVLALGEMGIGNTASAALLAHKIAGLPLLVGRGAGLDDAGLRAKQLAVAQGAARTAARLSPYDALAGYGGFEIAMLAGAILRGAERRMCIVIDGVIVTAAALVAHAIEPTCLAACVFAHRSAEPGHDAMLAYLGAVPLLDLGLRLGEGTGAALAIPLLRAAAALPGMADLAELL